MKFALWRIAVRRKVESHIGFSLVLTSRQNSGKVGVELGLVDSASIRYCRMRGEFCSVRSSHIIRSVDPMRLFPRRWSCRLMPLTISLHTPSSIPLEVDTVVLETVRGQSADDVKQTLIQRGNRQVPVGEFFHVHGSAADDNTLVWQGDLAKVKLIGTKLTTGTTRVEGNAGMHLGAEMSGGEIIVDGNVADWCGAEMHGGSIRVRGNAGHLVGAVYRGGHKGMTGGEILIHGDAGNEVGHGIRRGLIAVAGNIGDFAGVGMIAGTILVGSSGGIRHGAGMKRGTIAFLNAASGFDPLPTFRSSGSYQPTFLRLILRDLQVAGFAVPDGAADATYERWCGDLVELGKGELLVRQAV